jgi:hypothetical protein
MTKLTVDQIHETAIGNAERFCVLDMTILEEAEYPPIQKLLKELAGVELTYKTKLEIEYDEYALEEN